MWLQFRKLSHRPHAQQYIQIHRYIKSTLANYGLRIAAASWREDSYIRKHLANCFRFLFNQLTKAACGFESKSSSKLLLTLFIVKFAVDFWHWFLCPTPFISNKNYHKLSDGKVHCIRTLLRAANSYCPIYFSIGMRFIYIYIYLITTWKNIFQFIKNRGHFMFILSNFINRLHI